ncbi:MAG: hypothetical protein WB729_25055 [Candidatus Sulfotelmatobacter sp.]
MNIKLTIENYRCFPIGSPVSLKLTSGFSAFVGANNAGKSSLLKFFYEMRQAFSEMARGAEVFQQLLGGRPLQLSIPTEVLDRDEMFFNGNRDDIRVEVIIEELPHTPGIVNRTRLRIARTQGSCTVNFFEGDTEITLGGMTARAGSVRWSDDVMENLSGATILDFQHIRSAFRMCADMYYVPAFRHISALRPAEGAVQSYYDINVGKPFIEHWHGLQAGASKEGQERIYRLIGEIKDNFGFHELQISAAMDRNTLRLMIDGKPFSLQEIGGELPSSSLCLETPLSGSPHSY